MLSLRHVTVPFFVQFFILSSFNSIKPPYAACWMNPFNIQHWKESRSKKRIINGNRFSSFIVRIKRERGNANTQISILVLSRIIYMNSYHCKSFFYFGWLKRKRRAVDITNWYIYIIAIKNERNQLQNNSNI
jgi:hypothetical protein